MWDQWIKKLNSEVSLKGCEKNGGKLVNHKQGCPQQDGCELMPTSEYRCASKSSRD